MSKKSRLAGLILLSVTIVYVIAIYVSIQNYNAWREEKLLECPVEIRPYVDFNPFWATKLGSFMVLISFAIGFCWVLFVYAISQPKLKASIVTLALMMFVASFCFTNLSVAYGYSVEKYVDVLVVRDEEWKAGIAAVSVPPYPIPIPITYNTTAEIAMELVAERFNEVFGIQIRWHCWVEWDSNDAEDFTPFLLSEAIRETGFQPGMSYDGYVIDMLVVFCGQYMDMAGLSPPDWQALILKHVWHYRVDNVLQHEFSHQFYAEHCSHSCIMNPGCALDPFIDVEWWCSDCQATIQAHADRFWRVYGGGCPILSVYDGSEYVEEGLLDIHNPEGTDLVYEHFLATTPQRVDGAYLMRLTEHPKTHSFIDQVKLYAMLEDGTMKELPLTWAWHSEDGNVLPMLLHSDEWKADTLGADHNEGTSQSIDLKFAALSPNLEVTGFMFQIEGNNSYFK